MSTRSQTKRTEITTPSDYDTTTSTWDWNVRFEPIPSDVTLRTNNDARVYLCGNSNIHWKSTNYSGYSCAHRFGWKTLTTGNTNTGSPLPVGPRDESQWFIYTYGDRQQERWHKQSADQQVPWTEAGIWGRWYFSNFGLYEQLNNSKPAMLTGFHLMLTGASDEYYGTTTIRNGSLFSWGPQDYFSRILYMNNAYTDTLWFGGNWNWSTYATYLGNYAPAQVSIVPGGCKYIYNASTARIMFDGFWYPGLTRADYLWGIQVYSCNGDRLLATLDGGPRNAGGLTAEGGAVMGFQSNSRNNDSSGGFLELSCVGTTDPDAFSQQYKDDLYCPPGTVIDNFLTNRTGTLDGRHVEWITDEGRQYSSGQWELKGGITPTYVVDATFGTSMIEFTSDPAVDFIWLDYDTDFQACVSFDLGTLGTGEITFIFRYQDNQNYEYFYVTAGGYSYGEYVAGVGAEITASGTRTNRYQNVINFHIHKTFGSPAAPDPFLAGSNFNGDWVEFNSGGTPPTGITNGLGFSANKGARVSCVKIIPIAYTQPDRVPNNWPREYQRGKSEYFMGNSGTYERDSCCNYFSYGSVNEQQMFIETWSFNNESAAVSAWPNAVSPLSNRADYNAYYVNYKAAGHLELGGRHYSSPVQTYPYGMMMAMGAMRWLDDYPGSIGAIWSSGCAWRGLHWCFDTDRYPGDTSVFQWFGEASFEIQVDQLGPPHTGGHAAEDDNFGTVELNNSQGNGPLNTLAIDQTVALHADVPKAKIMFRLCGFRHMNLGYATDRYDKFLPGSGAWQYSGVMIFNGPELVLIGIDSVFKDTSNHDTGDYVGMYIANGEPDETTVGDNNWATKVYRAGSTDKYRLSANEEGRWAEYFQSGTGSIDGTTTDVGGGTWTVIGANGANSSTLQTNGTWSYGGGSRETLAYIETNKTNLFGALWCNSPDAAEAMVAFRIVDGDNFWIAGFYTNTSQCDLVRFVAQTPTVMATYTRAKYTTTNDVNHLVRTRTSDSLFFEHFYYKPGAMTADTTHNTATKIGIYMAKSGNPGSGYVDRYTIYDATDPRYLDWWQTCIGADQ